MGILERLKRGKQTSKKEYSGIVSNAKKNSMTAIEYAKSFQKNFDFSERGYCWGIQNTGNIPLLMVGDEKYITLVDKVYKRLVNGTEDNMVSFYQMMMEEG